MLVSVTKVLKIKAFYKANSKSLTDGRARVQFNGKVNDKTEAVVRVKGNYEFGDSTKVLMRQSIVLM